MLALLVPAAWLLLALIHAAPAAALVRPSLLTALYRIAPDNPLFLLMQHRAALFAGVLIACIWAAFDPSARPVAALVTALSVLSFLALYALAGQPPALRTIALADLIGLPALTLAAWSAVRHAAAP